MSELVTNKGERVLIDDIYYPFLVRWPWSLNNSGYVSSSLGLLHHLVYGPKPPQEKLGEIAHKNHNKLDNRRSNLECIPHWLNQILTPERSGVVKGVSSLPGGKWKAEIQLFGDKYYIGSFDSYQLAIGVRLQATKIAKDLYDEQQLTLENFKCQISVFLK